MNCRSFREVNGKIDGFSFVANEALWLTEIYKNKLESTLSLETFHISNCYKKSCSGNGS